MNRIVFGIIGLILGFSGACIIGYNSNFYVTTGVFLLLWGNNIGNSFNRQIISDKTINQRILTK